GHGNVETLRRRAAAGDFHSPQACGRSAEQLPGVLVMHQQGLDLPAQGQVVTALVFQEGDAIAQWQLAGCDKELLDPLMAFGSHPSALRSSRRSHALAIRHSSRTVRSDMPKNSAVSCSVRPPKKRRTTTWFCRSSSVANSASASVRARALGEAANRSSGKPIA